MLRSAKRTANAFLLGAFAIYVVSFLIAKPFLHDFLRTAGEAGTVGGLADWFAVTALFRHPLGIPIPHTALIPKRKDQIGSSIALFVQNNFVVKDNIIAELRSIDRAQQFGKLLVDEQVSFLLADTIAKTLQVAVRKGSYLDIIGLLLPVARRILVERKGDIEDAISRMTGKFIPGFFDKIAAKRITSELDRLLIQLGLPDSNERRELDAWFRLQVENIPDHLKGQARKIAIELKSPEFLSRLASDSPPQALVSSIAEALKNIGRAILQSADYRQKINSYLEQFVLMYVAPFGDQIGNYIEKTVKSWDAKTITESLENQVGKDLQFIRINGTVIGMLAGVTLFIFSQSFIAIK